ncbi:LGFP repeat-containing protein [Rhodococcus sp. 1.20]
MAHQRRTRHPQRNRPLQPLHRRQHLLQPASRNPLRLRRHLHRIRPPRLRRRTIRVPTTDEYATPDGRRTDFQGGWIAWIAATGQIVTS